MPSPSFVCWEAGDAAAILGSDAENVSDDVFLAVHSENVLSVEGADGARVRVEARELLGQFLSTPDAKAVVLGASGSGKSHLIQWMWLNMPRSSGVHVLRIPKIGISLRNVLQEIIGILPPERQAAYRERLEGAGFDQMDTRQRVRALIAMIGLSIAADDPEAVPGTRSRERIEDEKDLVARLPHVFSDPHLQTAYFQVPGGKIEQLVEHVFEPSLRYRHVEGRRAFVPEDLPLEGVDIAVTAGPTRAILRDLVSFPDMVPIAIDVINRNLNAAIARVLNFTGDQLIDLMTDVREYLHGQGKTLVLLIEDFARIQGLDVPLAQALTVPSKQGARRLCEMRWAMAVTRGYFEQSRDSLKTRMDFVVDMDAPTEGSVVAAFAARYLNAVRIGLPAVKRWYEDGPASGEDRALPNRCDGCAMRDGCHPVFGSVDGMGLYPLTARALSNMVDRVDKGAGEAFNPRTLLLKVLRPVFDTCREDLRAARFPPAALLQRMGGGRLSPLDQQTIENLDPAHADRQRALLELWGSGERLVDLDPGLSAAFALRGLGAFAEAAPPPREDGGGVDTPEPPRQPSEPGAVTAIRRWANGADLPQGVANDLRGMIYDALEDYIDWDGLGLERAAFARKAAPESQTPFRNGNISFIRQETRTGTNLGAGSIGLRIPLADDAREMRDAALALEGLWHFGLNRHWNFPNGAQYAIAVAEMLERWGAHVAAAITRWPDANLWDPLEASVELLAVGAALGGRLSGQRLRDADVVDAMFSKWPERSGAQSAAWQALYASLRARQGDLAALVKSRSSGGKGGKVGGFLDPAPLLPILERLRATWLPCARTPAVQDGARDLHGRLAKLHSAVREALPAAAAEEHALRMEWLGEVRDAVSVGSKRGDVVAAVEQLRMQVGGEALSIPAPLVREVDAALDHFKSTPFDGAVRTAEGLEAAVAPLAELPRLVRDRNFGATETSRRLFEAVRRLLDAAEAGLSEQLGRTRAQVGEALPRDQAAISRDLADLVELLVEIVDDVAARTVDAA